MHRKSSSEHLGVPPAESSTWVGQRGVAGEEEAPAPETWNVPEEAPGPSVAGVYEVEVGRVIDGRYRVESRLGEGAVGLVYRCRHLVLGKDVAIKVLRPDFARDKEISERLVVEAKAASAIGSAHIVETVDFGYLLDGTAYFVMEYLDGVSLADRLESGPLSEEELLHVALQIAEALGAAHARGIVHRDLKPDNVFLVRRGEDPNFVKVLDFGIAKLARAERKLTRAGQIYGTPHYMSPEQASGRPTDSRTDIYSLGVMLFEMATGNVPFDGEQAMGILSQHVHDEPPALAGVMDGLEAVVHRCLAKAKEDRYESMTDLSDDLVRLLHGIAPQTASTPRPNSVGAYSSRPPPPSVSLPPSAPPPARVGASARVAYVLAAAGLLASAGLGYRLATRGDATPRPGASAASATAVAAGSAAPAPEAPPEQDGQDVMVLVFPHDARIIQGKQDLGTMPVTVKVPDGDTVRLAIRRPGYVSRRLVLDGKKARVVVGLVPEKGSRHAKRDPEQETDDDKAEQEPDENAPAERSADGTEDLPE